MDSRSRADAIEKEGKVSVGTQIIEPPLSTLDKRGNDPLLAALRAKHGDAGRPDIAPKLVAAERATKAEMFAGDRIDAAV